MNTQAGPGQWRLHPGGWGAALISALGAVTFFLWQPLADLLVTRTYADNIVLVIDAETMPSTAHDPVLIIRPRVLNRGSVPVTLATGGQGMIRVEVHRVTGTGSGRWLEPETGEQVAERTLFGPPGASLSVAPNAHWGEEIAIPLPKGTYWIRATLQRTAGASVSDATYFNHGK
jgi:hypothetical protein